MKPLLQARNVKMHISAGSQRVIRAVDGVSLDLYPGQVTALVGESGSGKTTMARIFSMIYQPTSGEVLYDGKAIKQVRRSGERRYYKNVQLIFQDPFASLNSLKKISYILGRALRIHKVVQTPKAVRQQTLELLDRVHLSPPERYIDRYPSDLSGGQRQRVAIARSLAMQPKVILADEPTSMLDASIRLDVLNLLDELRREQQLAVLYITHDIASARYLADRVHVMYGGVVVESGEAEQVIGDPQHPYTKLLLASAPDPARYKGSGRATRIEVADANPVDNTVEHVGCRFVDRCPAAQSVCRSTAPPVFTSPADHAVRCWLVKDDPSFPTTSSNEGDPSHVEALTAHS